MHIIIFLLALLNLEFAHFLHYLSEEREFQEVSQQSLITLKVRYIYQDE